MQSKTPKTGAKKKNTTTGTETETQRNTTTKSNTQTPDQAEETKEGETKEGEQSTALANTNETREIEKHDTNANDDGHPNGDDQLILASLKAASSDSTELALPAKPALEPSTLKHLLRSALNKLCRVEPMLPDGTRVTKHARIPMDTVRPMSISEGQRLLSKTRVEKILASLLENPAATTWPIQALNLDDDVTTDMVLAAPSGLAAFKHGSTGGNHYTAALKKISRLHSDFYEEQKELHFKDGEVYAMGHLKQLLEGERTSRMCSRHSMSKHKHKN